MSITPNTFQCFNIYVDRALELLTDSELRVLLFATRHIMGWQEKVETRQGYISLSMFENGYSTDKGLRFAGCGIGRHAIVEACKKLVVFGFLKRETKSAEFGQQWQLTTDNIRWDLLQYRADENRQKQQKRLKKANDAKAAKALKVSSNEPDDKKETGGSSNDTLPSSSNDTLPSSSNDTQTKPLSKPDSKPLMSGNIPAPLKQSKAEKAFRSEWQHYSTMGDALLTAFGLDFVPAANQTTAALTPYLEVARELSAAGAVIEEIPHLSKYISARAHKDDWSKYSVKTFSRYYTDFLKTRRSKIINDDPAMDLSKPIDIVPILMQKTEEAS